MSLMTIEQYNTSVYVLLNNIMSSYIKNIYIKICTLHVLKVIDNYNNMVTFCELINTAIYNYCYAIGVVINTRKIISVLYTYNAV